MRKIWVMCIVFCLFLFSCSDAGNDSTDITDNPSNVTEDTNDPEGDESTTDTNTTDDTTDDTTDGSLVRSVLITPKGEPASQSSGGQVIGNKEGTVLSNDSSRGLNIRATTTETLKTSTFIEYKSTYLWQGDDGLPKDEVLNATREQIDIEEFKITADINLHSKNSVDYATIMAWGGDPNAEPMVDLINGTLESDISTSDANLKNKLYETVRFQINTEGESVKPLGNPALTWPEVVPFFVDTSNQIVIMSTLISEPFVNYVEAQDYDFDPTQYQTLIDAGVTEQVDELYKWTSYAPINEEFFQAAREVSTTDPGPGVEPWLFIPMHESIDLTGFAVGDKIAFSFELFFKDLLYEHYYENDNIYYDSNYFYYLTPFNAYEDQDGNKFYGPLPLRIDYAENTNGIEIIE